MNKIYIKINESNEIIYTHYIPFDQQYGLFKSEEELLKDGYLTNAVEPPLVEEGKDVLAKYNTNEDLIYYEIVDAKLTEEQVQAITNKEKIVMLEQTVANLEYTLMMGGLL